MVPKKTHNTKKNNKTGSFTSTQIRLRSRRATDIVIPLIEGQERKVIVGLTISGMACNKQKLII